MRQPFRTHVLVCTQEKPDRTPCCAANGGRQVIEKLQAEIDRAGRSSDVLVTACGCLGLCERGPNVIVYPEGRWYTRVQPADVPAFVRDGLLDGRPSAEREDPDPGTIRAEVNEHRAKYQRAMAARGAAGVLPEDLDALVRGFQPSRTVLTAIELDVFTALGQGSDAGATSADVASRTSASPHGMEALLNALVSLGLLLKKDGRFRNAPAAETFLRAGAPHDARAALKHTVQLWDRWGTLTECVRQGGPVAHLDMAERGTDWTEPFIAAMHRHATFRAPVVVGALDLAGVRRVLDVGGGSGAYAAAFARARQDLTATVFDLPSVTPLTRRYLDTSGVGDRVHTVNGDLRTDAYGRDFDLVLASAICHMLGPDENVALFRKIRAALAPGGRVVVHDFVLDDDKAGPRSGALFALNMLVGTLHGSSYSAEEYCAFLAQAGFEGARTVPLPGPTDLVVAARPA